LAYYSPIDLPSALDIIKDRAHKIVAGGTDVYPSMKQGQTPSSFLDVTRIKELSGVVQNEAGTRIGATATWSDIVKADLPAEFRGLKEAAREVGSLQIQNAGTIAGNICNASPAADGVPPLLALNAQVELASAARGTRTLALSDFILGVRQTALMPDEIVTAIYIPPELDNTGSAFEKLGCRRYLVISISMTAANISLDSFGRISKARVAVGACSAVAQRLPMLERHLIGNRIEGIEVLEKHLTPLSPIDDVRGSGAYRLDVVQEQCKRAILRAAGS
jgi:CO/xanthine dehydrogenase FAD-binding subunit